MWVGGLDADPTLYCVSAWNDNGQERYVRDPSEWRRAAPRRCDVLRCSIACCFVPFTHSLHVMCGWAVTMGCAVLNGCDQIECSGAVSHGLFPGFGLDDVAQYLARVRAEME